MRLPRTSDAFTFAHTTYGYSEDVDFATVKKCGVDVPNIRQTMLQIDNFR